MNKLANEGSALINSEIINIFATCSGEYIWISIQSCYRQFIL